MKHSYLVGYDYGMRGVWAVIKARSKDEITTKYPMLVVVDHRPDWMTQDRYNKIAANFTVDIDDDPPGWLISIVSESSRGATP